MAEIIEIEDINDARIAPFIKLTEAQLKNKLNPDDGIFICESPIAISQALRAGCEPVSVLTEPKYISGRMCTLIEGLENIPVYSLSHENISKITGYELTRGALCAMKRPAPKDWRDLCKGARRVAVLEDIVDTTNLGAIFRNAAALGIDAVLLTPSCCDPLLRRSVRVSMGTVLQVPFARIGEHVSDWPRKMISELHDMGFKTVSMALRDNTLNINDPVIKNQDKLAVILGTEGDGLRSETIELSDFTVKIPMFHGVDSLNVAAASAIAFFEIV